MKKIGSFPKKNIKPKMPVCFETPILLYTVLVAVLVNLFVLFCNKDDQSLFLFIIISALVYSITNNMTIVLISAMIIVNSLVLLRHFLQKKSIRIKSEPRVKIEGFTDQLDDIDYIEIQDKIDEYTKSTKFSKIISDDVEETETDGYELIQNVLDNPVFDGDEKFLEEDYNREPVDLLLEFISDIKDKYEEDDEEITDEIQYFLDLDEYINNTDE